MKTKTINVYSFEELSDSAKQKALDKLYDINVNFEWWEFTYDDAKNVGLIINEFDIDRAGYVKASFDYDAIDTAKAILDQHGETCETYKTTKEFLQSVEDLKEKSKAEYINEYGENYENAGMMGHNEVPTKEDYFDENFCNELKDLADDFLYSLREDYLKMLRDEYEYQTSEEAIKETIEANEYEFDEDGNML